MKVTAFGHSAFLIEMAGEGGRLVRVLGDPWLSDYVIGDVMGRFPRVRLDVERMPELDGIYLSHSHTDHLDPYALVSLWQELPDPKPALLVPQSLEYLVALLVEFLPGARSVILRENESFDLGGVAVRGLFNLEETGTNEDDVMMLHMETETELFLGEADAVLPYGDPEARETLASLLESETLQVACFLAIKNELDSMMASVHASSREERIELVEAAREATIHEIDAMYFPSESEVELWSDPRLVRLVGGQGICYPQKVDPTWNKVLFPLPLEERARLERDHAEGYGHELPILAFEPGTTYEVVAGQAPKTTPCDFLKCLDDPADIDYDDRIDRFENFPDRPLRTRAMSVEQLEPRLLEALNGRFLPWMIGRRQPPLEHLLSHYDGEYRIRVRYGSTPGDEERDYRITFGALTFAPVPVEGDAQEVYWAADLDDYLDGRCDDFSTFCRAMPGGDARHFWDCLGMPYLNNDLCEKKLRVHFERARAGESVEDWVLPLYDGLADH